MPCHLVLGMTPRFSVENDDLINSWRSLSLTGSETGELKFQCFNGPVLLPHFQLGFCDRHFSLFLLVSEFWGKRVTQTYNNKLHSVTSFPPTYIMFNVIPPDKKTHLNPYPEITIAREIARSRTQNKHKR
ncbi:hypothetical protein LAZ67_2003313 [Cordylochernes scorpioides]|uniref:Uncharacterized protein n=1 Tax=Cordylochernes scorpioides TaxID=51811 RepID=A0ABY6K4E7_9ARAC|nr:hypothetical protein LAZ67_2003313 [Cordylochernes scorpioides]